jgi:hypothetical protein
VFTSILASSRITRSGSWKTEPSFLRGFCHTKLRALWIYYEKFLTNLRFLFRMLPFTTEKDDDLEHSAQEQEERCTTTIDFEFHRGLKNSVTTFQAAFRQPATINPINSLVRPLIRTPLTTTRSSGLALSEIRTTKPEESA